MLAHLVGLLGLGDCYAVNHLLEDYLDHTFVGNTLVDEIDVLTTLEVTIVHVLIGVQVDLVDVYLGAWSLRTLRLSVTLSLAIDWKYCAMVYNDAVVGSCNLGDSLLLTGLFFQMVEKFGSTVTDVICVPVDF